MKKTTRKTVPTVTQQVRALAAAAAPLPAARTYREANPAVPSVLKLPTFRHAFEQHGIELEKFARTQECTPEAEAACEAVDAAEAVLIATIDDLIPSPYLDGSVQTAAQTPGLLESLDRYVMAATVHQNAPADEASPEYKSAEAAAVKAHGTLYEFLDGMLRNAFSNGVLFGQTFPAAKPAPCPEQEAEPMDVHKLLHDTLTETGFHENLTAALVVAGNQALYYRDNVKSLADEGRAGYQAQEALLSNARKIVRANVGQFGMQMFIAGMEAAK